MLTSDDRRAVLSHFSDRPRVIITTADLKAGWDSDADKVRPQHVTIVAAENLLVDLNALTLLRDARIVLDELGPQIGIALAPLLRTAAYHRLTIAYPALTAARTARTDSILVGATA